MDFRELSYVLAIAKHQNITKAAESVYVGQPSLSKFLITLESDLGIKLFRRLGHKYVLTHAGECYVEKAKQILRLKQDLDTEMMDIKKHDVGVLDVAFPNMRSTYMLPATLPVFNEDYPNVKVNVYEGTSSENDQRLLDGQVEVAFYTKPSTLNPLLTYEPLGEEELLICTCKDHPIKKFSKMHSESVHPKLDLHLLENERVILMTPQQRTRQIVDSLLHDEGVTLHNVICTSNLPATIKLASMGYGIAFIFDSHLTHYIPEISMDCYSVGDKRLTTEFVAAYRKGSYLHTYTHDFIEIVKDAHDW